VIADAWCTSQTNEDSVLQSIERQKAFCSWQDQHVNTKNVSQFDECMGSLSYDDYNARNKIDYHLKENVNLRSVTLDYSFYPCSQDEEDQLETGVTCVTDLQEI